MGWLLVAGTGCWLLVALAEDDGKSAMSASEVAEQSEATDRREEGESVRGDGRRGWWGSDPP